MTIRDEKLAAVPRRPEEVKAHIADYYAIISHMDEQIGRLMEALTASGEMDNTLVVFTSDNGLAVGSHGLMGKQNLYEHSVLVPVIISGPSLPAGGRREALCYLIDLFPTLCGLAGLGVPETSEGISLVPVIRGRKQSVRDDIFLAYRHIQRGLRTVEGWKLIEYRVQGRQKSQLFYLPDDPWEVNDLSGVQESVEQLSMLRERLRIAMDDLDDFCDPEAWSESTKDPALS
jgi:arylsulfatase A-like enzyme